MSIKSDIQDIECRDQGKKKSWQDSRINRIGQNGNDGEIYETSAVLKTDLFRWRKLCVDDDDDIRAEISRYL